MLFRPYAKRAQLYQVRERRQGGIEFFIFFIRLECGFAALKNF
jgi:hypothetical protein